MGPKTGEFTNLNAQNKIFVKEKDLSVLIKPYILTDCLYIVGFETSNLGLTH